LLIEITGDYASVKGAKVVQLGRFGEWLRVLTVGSETAVTSPAGETLARYGTSLSDMDGNLITHAVNSPPPSLLLPPFPTPDPTSSIARGNSPPAT
jgi:hypothetical protein